MIQLEHDRVPENTLNSHTLLGTHAKPRWTAAVGLLAAACLAATDSTYPRSIRRELFYTDIEKRSAQGNEYRALRPKFPAARSVRACVQQKSRGSCLLKHKS
jgi:hypothetical protein